MGFRVRIRVRINEVLEEWTFRLVEFCLEKSSVDFLKESFYWLSK